MTDWKELTEKQRNDIMIRKHKIGLIVEQQEKKIKDFSVGKTVMFEDKFTSEDVYIYHEMAAQIPDSMFKGKFTVKKIVDGRFNIDLGFFRVDYRVLKLV